jgi:outer membrane protein OmpA-like peptidoglycan-associated protein
MRIAMKPLTSSLTRRLVLLAATALLAAVAACTTAPTASTDEQAFDQAVATATDGLVAQSQKLPAFVAKLINRAVVVDPMLEAGSGQQTALTHQLEDKVAARLRSNQFELLPFEPASLGKAQYLLTGTLARLHGAKAGSNSRVPFQINLALVDLKSGNVVAQSSARARDDGQDTTPTPYYRDSPVLVKDKVVDGYIRTAATAPGRPADADYFQRVNVAMVINAATTAYDAERYQEALGLYRNALASPTGEQLRSLNGVYLASWKLGHAAEAEQAFGKVVAHGIANNNLGVKFLFNPGSTEFWSDPKVSGPYPIWLRQIARNAASSKVCMNVVGHTSHTGGEAYNDRLSEQRAMVIRQKLAGEAAELGARMKASGVGFRQNIIGTGTDDASDALDRRVEFRILGCGAA